MRMRSGMAGVGVVLACLSGAACDNELPTGVSTRIERSSAILPNGGATTQSDATGGIGGFGFGSGNATTQSDTTTRGIGGFGSGN